VLLGTAVQEECPRNHKLQWTWLSSDPITVDIFVGMVILSDATHLTVSSAQVHVDGILSHLL